MKMILNGKKTILVPADFNTDGEKNDFDFFCSLYLQVDKTCLAELNNLGSSDEIRNFFLMNEKTGMFQGWICYTAEGKASKRFGVVFAMVMRPHIVSIHGIVDKAFIKGLAKKLEKKDKVTYTEDAFRTAVGFCMNLPIDRLETTIEAGNKLAQALVKKCGFQKEGTLRKYMKVGDQCYDMVMYSMLQEGD